MMVGSFPNMGVYKMELLCLQVVILGSYSLLGYLKLWQLSKPLLASFDAIFVDEAQDCTPGDKLFKTSVVSNT